MKFEEGTWYQFKIDNIIHVPEKGEHFVLLHESGRKMLLNAQYYVKYNFSIGQYIDCRVDKVNCTGQVFLEPKHPHYKEGLTYTFQVIRTNVMEDQTINIFVKDYFENDIQLLTNHLLENEVTGSINLKVDRVKKGFPILSQPVYEKPILNISSESIKVMVKDIILINSVEFYTFTYEHQVVARLKVKHFKNYGFKVGAEILCYLRGHESNGLLIIEPENPWYKVGVSYPFKISSIEEYLDLNGDSIKSAVVIDIGGNKCGVILNNSFNQMNNSSINCKVTGFRKGRPQLEIDPN